MRGVQAHRPGAVVTGRLRRLLARVREQPRSSEETSVLSGSAAVEVSVPTEPALLLEGGVPGYVDSAGIRRPLL
jgi:hypothetical protein